MSRISIVGFGPQAQIQAQILKKQSWDVKICLRSKSPKRTLAENSGFKVILPQDLGKEDYVYLLIPDQEQADFYTTYLHQNLTKGTSLVFAHGFAVHYQLIKPRSDLDIVLCVLKGTATMIAEDSKDLHAVLAVQQDYSGTAKAKLNKLIQALGIDQEKRIWSSFQEETLANLFAEQYARGLCIHILKTTEEVLKSYGVQDSLARLESWDLSAKILTLMAQAKDHDTFVESMSPLARIGVEIGRKLLPSLPEDMNRHLKIMNDPDFIQSMEKSLKKN